MQKDPSQIHVAALDIECTNLAATYGRILCTCVKFFHEKKVRSFVAHDENEEAALLKDLAECYEDIDILVTYNGKMFDFPYLNARYMRHGMKPLPVKIHMDLYWQAKKLRFASKRLENMGAMLGMATGKFHVHPNQWVEAANGNIQAHKKILKHCEEDVKMTQELFGKLKPLMVRFTR